MIGTTINNRYRIETELGQGGMGTVYRAFDETLQRDVALKMLSNTHLGTEGRARMLREARTAANLNHPNIVVVYDAGEHEDIPYIVMELVEGKTLHDRKPESLEEVVEVTKQICLALDHAHQHGIIHRDLKPENVIVETSGDLKLMDFGLARSVATRMTSEGIMGTLYYLAPEQATGEKIDQRADLYALGVMLYEFVTGVLPFDAEDPVAIITQHIHAPVVPPKAKREDLPGYLNRLILSLLSKEPADRPSSAREVIERLATPAPETGDLRDSKEITLLDRIVRGRIIGRKKEVLEARQLWENAAAGSGELLLISGEPGIGKTRLTREITTQVRLSRGQTLMGESSSWGGKPYDAIAQIVRSAFEKKEEIARSIPSAVLEDIIRITPEIQPFFPDIQADLPEDPQFEQHRLLESGVTFFTTLARETPLLLLFDDIHWADSGTLNMVRNLARRIRNLPVMILGTYREIEIEEARLFQDFLLEMDRRRFAKRIKLTRLNAQQTAEMLVAIFQEDVSPEFAEGIYRETEGNPFFIEEVCKAIVESGQVYFENGKWHRPEDGAAILIPQSIKSTIEQRLNRLDEESRRVLTLASVIGREFDFDVLLKLSEIDEGYLLDVIDEALKTQLIQEKRVSGRDIYSFEHALINHTLYDDLNLRRKTRLHQQVGLAMETVYDGNIEAHVEELAHHFFLGARGEVIEKAIRYNEMAGEQALRVYAFEDAVHFFEQVVNLLEDLDRIPETIPLRIRIGDVHFHALNRQKATENFLKAISMWESLPENEKVKEVGIDAYTKVGEARRFGVVVPGAKRYVEKGLSMIGDEPTMVRARLLKGLAWVTSFLVTDEESDLILAKKAGTEALSIFKSFEAYDEISSMMDCLATINALGNNFPRSLEICEQRLELVDHVSVYERADIYHMIGDYSRHLNDFARSEVYELKALKMGIDDQLVGWQFQIRWDMAELYIYWDRWDDALQRIHEYIDFDIETGGVYWNSNFSVPGLAMAASTIYELRGEPQKGEAILEKASQSFVSEDEKTFSFRTNTDRLINAELLSSLGKIREAEDLMDEIDKERLVKIHSSRFRITEIELSEKRSIEELTELERRLEEETPWEKLLLGRVKRLIGMEYANLGAFSQGQAKLEESTALFADLGAPWKQGLSLDKLGDLFAKQGEKNKAAEKYHQALSLFTDMRAQYNIDRTDQKLKAIKN